MTIDILYKYECKEFIFLYKKKKKFHLKKVNDACIKKIFIEYDFDPMLKLFETIRICYKCCIQRQH